MNDDWFSKFFNYTIKKDKKKGFEPKDIMNYAIVAVIVIILLKVGWKMAFG